MIIIQKEEELTITLEPIRLSLLPGPLRHNGGGPECPPPY